MVLSIKVEKKNAQKIKTELLEKNLINLDYKMRSDKNYVYFPVLGEYKNYDLINKKFDKNKLKPIKLSQIFQKILPKSKINSSKRSYDLIGDIAIVEFEDGIKKYEKRIAEELKPENSWQTTLDWNPDSEAGGFKRFKLFWNGLLPKSIL